jgi:hypothetical protein
LQNVATFFRNVDFLIVFHLQLRPPPAVFHLQLRPPPVLGGALDAGAGPRRGRAAPRPAGRGRRGRAAPRPLVRARRRRAAGKLLHRAPARDRRPHARGRDTSAGGARAWKPRRTATSRAGQRRRDRAGRSGAAGGGATMHSGGACEVFSWLGFQHVGLCGPSWAAMGL